MPSSIDIWILSKIPELAQRCGVKLVDADIEFTYLHNDDLDGEAYYAMHAVDTTTIGTKEYGQKILKLWSLLGLDEGGYRRFDDISEAVDAVEQALKLAPRARLRD